MAYVTNAGVPLWYDVCGDGPPLVLLHGRAGNAASWWRQVALFSRTHTVVTYDQRGFGRSPCEKDDFNAEMLAPDIAAILDAIGIERAALISQSMGGISAMRFARDYPERTAGLIVGSSLAGITPKDIRGRLAERERANTVTLPDRAFAPDYSAREPLLYELYKQILAFNTCFSPAWRSRITGSAASFGAEDFDSYAVPTTFIVGAHDQFFPPSFVHEVAAWVPGATVIDIPDAGHSPYWETPYLFNEIVLNWLGANAVW
jgi:3-oxoadipate enol-lactonase